jgi:hypothetical protein
MKLIDILSAEGVNVRSKVTGLLGARLILVSVESAVFGWSMSSC